MYCENCGDKIVEFSRYCKKCGKSTTTSSSKVAPFPRKAISQSTKNSIRSRNKKSFLFVSTAICSVIALALILLTYRSIIDDNGGIVNNNAKNEKITLDKARETPGLYIMDNELFTLIDPTPLTSVIRASQWSNYIYASMIDADYEIYDIVNNTQLVIIGIETVDICKIINSGYSIPYYIHINESVAIYDNITMDNNYGGLGYPWRSGYTAINNLSPDNFLQHIIPVVEPKINYYDPFSGVTGMNFYGVAGILNTNLGDEIVLGKFEGTEWTENILTANQRYSVHGDFIDINIEKTMDGYFLVDLPNGLYGKHIIFCYNSNNSIIGLIFVNFEN